MAGGQVVACEAACGFLRGDFPERLHRGLAVVRLLAAAVERRRAGVDEVQQAVRGGAGQSVAGHALDRLGAPIGAHVGENLRGVRQQMAEQHARAVERVVFRRDQHGSRMPFQSNDEFRMASRKSPFGIMVGPVALALEAGQDGVVAEGFLAEAELRQARIADHQVAHDHRRTSPRTPIPSPCACGCCDFRVVVLAFGAVLLAPRPGRA